MPYAQVETVLPQRVVEQLQQVEALLQQVDELVEVRRTLGAERLEQTGRAADEQVVRVHGAAGFEGAADGGQERPFHGAQLGADEDGVDGPRTEPPAVEALVEVVASEFRETFVDRLGEAEDPLRDAAGAGDDDHHDEVRLQRQDFDVAHRGERERWGRDDGQQLRDTAEGVRGLAQRLVELTVRPLALRRRRRRRRRRAAFAAVADDGVDVVAIAGVRRHAARRGVRVCQQSLFLQQRQVVADGGGRHAEVAGLAEVP